MQILYVKHSDIPINLEGEKIGDHATESQQPDGSTLTYGASTSSIAHVNNTRVSPRTCRVLVAAVLTLLVQVKNILRNTNLISLNSHGRLVLNKLKHNCCCVYQRPSF